MVGKKTRLALASLPEADRVRLFADIRKSSALSALQLADWIANTVMVTEAVSNEKKQVVPLYWIRLYGVLADIAERVNAQLQLGRAVGSPDRELGPMKRALDDLAAAFSKNELIYIQYLRHVHCHPLQDAYRLKLKEDGLQDTVFQHLLRKGVSLNIVKKKVRSVRKKHGNDEDAVAFALAKISLPFLKQLQRASLDWCGPPI